MVPTLPFVRQLVLDDTGPDVLAVARALVKWNRGLRDGVVLDRTMGAAKIKLLRHFQGAQFLHVDGVYGPATHAKLVPFVDAYGASLFAQEAAALAPRNRFLQVVEWTIAHVSIFDYSERLGDGPGERGNFRISSPFSVAHRLSCDCSQHFVGCGKWANLTHPIFGSEAATGAILDELEHITAAQALPGDGAVFVGPRFPAGAHITILHTKLPNGDWRTGNMGTQGQPAWSTLSFEQQSHARIGAGDVIYVRLPT